MNTIIGRKREQRLLEEYYHSNKAEFVVICGRRRVGKTFLIRECFRNKFAFYLSGAENATKAAQLKNFNAAINTYSGYPYPAITDWQEAFLQLQHYIGNMATKRKIVLFFDELPWLDNNKSGFLSAFEYFWNSFASAKSNILLIACGSATSWIVHKIINSRGGLHNRVTRQIFLEPFTLQETEQFLKSRNIMMKRIQISECYMIMGGVPYYLEQIDRSIGLSQNIDNLFFARNGVLKHEFSRLFSSLFKNSENYVKIIKALGKKNKGLTRDEMIQITKIANGGRLSTMLEELELCGFIRIDDSFNHKKKKRLYQLIDFYSMFYLKFIDSVKNKAENYWVNTADSSTYKAWCGFSFEKLCIAHLPQIRRKLGISGVLSFTSSWRYFNDDSGAQIDLLIDRKDNVINVCEMKYAKKEYRITKHDDESFRNKIALFQEDTKTRKTTHFTLISTFGAKHNEYWGGIQSEVTMDDLFERV
ncbi:MAG: ATP-binding protein [Bacteroidales bacterium]|jgi:AAA+ ATPase superfamily predicted ATPase|nr:ATP-binding protein [Bacteroidales bacterium]